MRGLGVDLSIEKEHNPAAPCYQGSAYFYENSQFGGSKFSLNVGQGENRLSERRRGWPGQDKNWNDQLTSLKLSPCTIVTLYENDYFGGAKKVYANTNHQTDMQINNVDAAWDNRVSSIKVQPYCGNDLCAYTPDELAQINEDISSVELSIEKEYSSAAPCYHGGAIFFDVGYFQGNQFELKSGFGNSNLILLSREGRLCGDEKNWDNQVSLLK